MKIKLILILILSYLWLNIFVYNHFIKQYEKNVDIYNNVKQKHTKLVKEIWNNITKLTEINKKLKQFKKIKEDSNVFYIKHFLEWILPNNNQTKSIKIVSWQKENTIEYKSSNFLDVLKVLNKLKQLTKNWIIQKYTYSKINKDKTLYIVNIKINVANLKLYLQNKEKEDFQLYFYNSLLWVNFQTTQKNKY